MPRRTITATFTITTPMFLGGVDQNAEPLLRVASLRGMLRWWWRALHYPQFYVAAYKSDPARAQAAALDSLRQAEIRLFGSNDQGQGAVHMRLQTVAPLRIIKVAPQQKLMNGRAVVGSGACYLAGQGLMVAIGNDAGTLLRSCIDPNQTFTLNLMVKPDLLPADIEGLLRAIKALGLLGGIGSRARRGWGSVSLTSLTAEGFDGMDPSFTAPNNDRTYKQAILDLLEPVPVAASEPLPPFSTLGPNSRIDILCQARSPLSALDTVGEAMQRYRCWGYHQMVNGVPSERNFPDDHDWYRPRPPGMPPLPKDSGVRPSGTVDRRASPLLLHIHSLANGQHIAAATILPAKFLPDCNGKRDCVETFEVSNAGKKAGQIDWGILDTFIDGSGPLSAPTKPYFPDKFGVLP
ncbi:MAG: type III-B CRISPR module RAMP protein Cmr1 [Magnetococcus sp. YQC-9]